MSGLCFPDDDLATTVDHLEELGAASTTIQASKLLAFGWDAGIDRMATSSVAVAGLVAGAFPFELGNPDSWDANRARIITTLDAAASLGARTVYVLTGRLLTPSGDSASWDDSAAAFAEAIAPVATHARSVGVRLAVEPTNALFAGINIVHSLSDASLLLERCDVGVCLDLFHVWTDRRLEEHIADLAGRIDIVQLSDHAPDRSWLPCYAVPGDGVVPLRRALRAVLDTGYDGPIDLEMYGPRIEAEGRINAIRRSIAWLETVLVELGVPDQHRSDQHRPDHTTDQHMPDQDMEN